jgi:branched-chain amino acid transport system ATP-binding protein
VLAKGVAQVPQSQALFPQMTIRENVLLGGYTLRRDKSLLNKRYDRVSELIPIVAERSNDKAGNLSGGQRRMVEIARCLMVDPSVLLLDEPSLGLDPKSLTGVSELVRDANAAGTTVLLVEQNVRLGLSMATHGVVLEGGRVRLEAPAGELMANPEVAELYLGGHASESRTARVGGASLPADAGSGR